MEKKEKLLVVTSWDDAGKIDIKLCELLERYNLKGTFYIINNWIGDKISPEEILNISEHHEIGAHTLNHVDLTQIRDEDAFTEISKSKILLENLIKKPITSFAYPLGRYNQNVVKIVRDSGYICARTTKPFYVKPPENPYEINVTLWAYPHALRDTKGLFRLFRIFPDIVYNPLKIKQWDKLGNHIFDLMLQFGGVFHIFGHTWQLDKKDGWKKLEELFRHISFRKEVRYVTVTEMIHACGESRRGDKNVGDN